MTKEEIIEMARQAKVYEELCNESFIYDFAKLVAAKERASNHAYIYELERDLEVAQDKINDCLGILNYNPRGKK